MKKTINMQISKQGKIMLGVLVVFIALTAILLACNWDEIRQGNLAQAEKTLTFTMANKDPIVLDYQQIKGLPAHTFDATIRSSGAKPKPVVYQGVLLKDLLTATGIDLTGKNKLVFVGADAYMAAVSLEELNTNDNYYVVYAMDGQAMKNKSQGGYGPYQLVILEDAFSQRWCKYLSEVQVQ